jgi:hypothetical protein
VAGLDSLATHCTGGVGFVLIRRMIRVRDAMRESTKLPNRPQFPFMSGPMNGNGAPHNGNGHNGTNGHRKKK